MRRRANRKAFRALEPSHDKSAGTAEADADAVVNPAMAEIKAVAPLLAASYYIFTSASLTVFNKLLFSHFPASHPPLLLLCQSLTALIILTVMSLMRRFEPPSLRRWARAELRAYAPLFAASLTMLLTSLLALQLTSLLMYNTLRRTSIIFVVTLHSLMHASRPSVYTVAATALITLGAVVATSTDLTFDLVGYSLAFAANASTAAYLVLLRPVRDRLSLTNLQLLYVNALVSVPCLAVVLVLMPPTGSILPLFSNVMFVALFFCSCSFAMVITHAIFVNTTVNDAIAQTIAAQLKDVLLLVCSVLFVDDPKGRGKGNLIGVGIGFIGSLVYGVGKLKDRNARASEESSSSPTEKSTPSLVRQATSEEIKRLVTSSST